MKKTVKKTFSVIMLFVFLIVGFAANVYAADCNPFGSMKGQSPASKQSSCSEMSQKTDCSASSIEQMVNQLAGQTGAFIVQAGETVKGFLGLLQQLISIVAAVVSTFTQDLASALGGCNPCASSCPPSNSNCSPGGSSNNCPPSNCPQTSSNCPQSTSNCQPSSSNCPQSTSNCPPATSNCPQSTNNCDPSKAKGNSSN